MLAGRLRGAAVSDLQARQVLELHLAQVGRPPVVTAQHKRPGLLSELDIQAEVGVEGCEPPASTKLHSATLIDPYRLEVVELDLDLGVSMESLAVFTGGGWRSWLVQLEAVTWPTWLTSGSLSLRFPPSACTWVLMGLAVLR